MKSRILTSARGSEAPAEGGPALTVSDDEGVRRALDHYVRLLEGLATALEPGADKTLDEIPMLGNGEAAVLAGVLKAPPGVRYPDWALNALGGIRATIDPMIYSASRAIAATLVDLLSDSEVVAGARTEFGERTGGGIGGTDWLAPLCDYEPPIHFPWPEYVTTERGRAWWIPAMPSEREEA